MLRVGLGPALLLVVSLGHVLTPGDAAARMRVHRDAGVTVTVPDAWTLEDGDDKMLATSPSGDAAVLLQIVRDGTIEQAITALSAGVATMVTITAPLPKARRMAAGSLRGVGYDVTAERNGKPVMVKVRVLATDDEFLCAVALSQRTPAALGEIDAILRSLARAR